MTAEEGEKITSHPPACAYVEVRIRKRVLSKKKTPCFWNRLFKKQEMKDGRKERVKTQYTSAYVTRIMAL
jgi:hypothetical protein